MLPNNMKIGIDFDDVIASTIHLKHWMAKEMFGVEGIPSHRFKESMVVEEGLMTKKQYRELMGKVCGEREIGLQASPVEEADIYINKLKNDNHHLVVITSREGPEFAVAREWCETKGYDMKYVSVGYGKDKKKATEGFDIYVDDDITKLLPLIGQVANLFLFSREHNIEVEIPAGVIRVNNWSELYTKIKNLF